MRTRNFCEDSLKLENLCQYLDNDKCSTVLILRSNNCENHIEIYHESDGKNYRGDRIMKHDKESISTIPLHALFHQCPLNPLQVCKAQSQHNEPSKYLLLFVT